MPLRAGALPVIAALAATLFAPVPARAAAVDGLFISVPNPIDDKAVEAIKRKLDDAILNKKRPIQTVVFDFTPHGLPAATSNWNNGNALAEFILDLRFGREKKYPGKLRTIAFLNDEVTRHTVLPVLACQQVYLSDAVNDKRQYRARIGNVADGAEVFNRNVRTAYENVAAFHDSPDMVMRLLDRSLELHQVRMPDGSMQYLSRASLEARAKDMKVEDLGVPTGLERGRSLFDPDEARKFGLCQGIVRDKAALLSVLRLTPHSLVEDHLLDQQVKVALFRLPGKVDRTLLSDLKKQVSRAIGERHNFLIFELDSSGGDARDAGSFAVWLSELTIGESKIPPRTLAYIPPKASVGAATFIALGCQEIVMGPDSFLADFTYILNEDKDRLKDVKEMLLPLAQKRGYPLPLFEAAVTPGMALYHVRDKKDAGEEQMVTAEQYQADKASATPRWENQGRIDAKDGELLKIPAARAQQWQVAVDTGAPVNRVDDLYGYYGIDPRRVTPSSPGWLYQVAEFFREPIVNFMLIMLGILGLILELKLPGTTVPGVLGAICFVLFFWSYSFVGEFTLLASLLFVLGIILIGIEVFVVPGFGFPGIAGIFLIIFSMVLVTLDNIPQTSEDWVNVGARITTLGLGVVFALIGAFALAYYLPSIPYANRLVLKPPDEMEGGAEGPVSLGPSYAHLLGAIGLAATTLRPAGKAQFGEEFYDVVAEGDYVNPGSRVQVIEVEGNRVVVKEI
ncbi:MAG: NfeD family protein [Gemmataceae bacterium]